MPRVVIVTYGSLGDLHPAIALAQGLRARGHDVTFATSEPYRAKITALGLPFHAVRPDLSLSDDDLVRRIMDGPTGSQMLMQELVYPSVRDMHADLGPLASKADLMVSTELVCAAPIVAEQHRLRWAFLALSPISFLPTRDPSILPGPALLQVLQAGGPAMHRFIHRAARLVSHSWWRPIRKFRRELGLAPGASPLFSGKFSPQLNLAAFSSGLQPPQPDWPPNTLQTGFLFHDEPESGPALPPAVQRFLEAGEAPIVFTLGSAAVRLAGNFYAESARAAEILGRRALLLLGENPAPANLPSTTLAWGYLPFARILPHASAVVHQGGIGTTAQTLRAGCPMLIVPFAHDQFDNAARIARLGAGRQIARRHYRAPRAARELAALLTQAFHRDQATVLGNRIRAERGVESACAALEGLLAK